MSQESPERFTSDRRGLLAAIGAGTTLSALGGTAAARGTPQEEPTPTSDVAQDGDDGQQDDDAGTVHEVQTLIQGPPTDQQRPADFFYQPTGLHVQPGDVVRFVFTTPDHNVTSYHPALGMRRRIPTGVGPIRTPILGWRADTIGADQRDPPSEMQGDDGGGNGGGDGDEGGTGDQRAPEPETWLYSFDTPGVYDLLCSPHEEFGMAMRVVVGDETETAFETSDPMALPEPRVGPVGLARTTLTDPALEPATIVEEETVEWGSLEANQTESSGGE